MKVIQPFFLGGGIGLVLVLGLAAAFFLSPLRKGLYLDWDPEISGLRDRLHAVREQAVAAELGIAAASVAATGFAALPPKSVDSLKRVQSGAWKEYRHWRARLGELSRRHDRATPAGFAHWTWSLRLFTLPALALLSLVPALLLAWRGARRASLPKVPKPPKPRAPKPGAPRDKGGSEALSTFQSAVKQVARISAASEARPDDRPPARTEAAAQRKTEYLPEVPRNTPVTPPAGAPGRPEGEILPAEPSPYEIGSEAGFREPGTDSIPLQQIGPARPEGIDTQIIQLGPEGWGDIRHSPPEPPAPARPAAREALSMEDEDAEDAEEAASSGIEEPPTGTFMPPTTEVERVERRKAEVLKLARKGLTSSEISRRMRISQDQVDFIIRMRREKG